ncbi:NAD(P)/FAD-dependent oxidoreductase [Pseudomonas sp. KNUC1026]|uniref:NAD(P)/FAD-dependent oxidoreductase n=1 Tax=Pseudomonas sp. KNUC1026 TaxID=2893890 RepID=UPI003FA6FC7E
MVDQLQLDEARLRLGGHIAAAHTPHALAGLQATADWVKRETGSASVKVIDAGQVRELTGSALFHGGLLTPHAGGLHPLNFARGLAWRLHERGVNIHVNSPALEVREADGRFVVRTPGGQVSARQVIYATNGYSDQTSLTASLHRRLIPFRSAIIATEPLAPALLASLMPGGQVCGDTKRMLRWFRVVGDRLIFGGRGAFGQHDSASAFGTLQRSMAQVFPQLAGTAVAFQWSGLVAMTLDYLPHAGQLGENQYYAVGYNGGGVAMSTWMGKQLAAMTAGTPVELGLLAGKGFNPIPLHGLRAPACAWRRGGSNCSMRSGARGEHESYCITGYRVASRTPWSRRPGPATRSARAGTGTQPRPSKAGRQGAALWTARVPHRPGPGVRWGWSRPVGWCSRAQAKSSGSRPARPS